MTDEAVEEAGPAKPGDVLWIQDSNNNAAAWTVDVNGVPKLCASSRHSPGDVVPISDQYGLIDRWTVDQSGAPHSAQHHRTS